MIIKAPNYNMYGKERKHTTHTESDTREPHVMLVFFFVVVKFALNSTKICQCLNDVISSLMTWCLEKLNSLSIWKFGCLEVGASKLSKYKLKNMVFQI